MNVVRKTPFDGQRQREGLSKLQDASGRDATELAQEVGLSYPQYLRYVWGKLPLRVDQFPTFARAYRITVADLARALGLLDDDEPAAWSFHAALHGIITPDEIERQWQQCKDESVKNQMAHALEIIEQAEERRSEAMPPPKPRRRQTAENRSA